MAEGEAAATGKGDLVRSVHPPLLVLLPLSDLAFFAVVAGESSAVSLRVHFLGCVVVV